MAGKEYYTTGDVARLTGYHYTTVQFWIQTGRIEARKIGGWWRIPRKEVERVLREKLGLSEQEVEELLNSEKSKN